MRFLLLILFLLTPLVQAAEWDLDTTFGVGGRQTLAFDAGGTLTDRIVKILRYPDSL